MRWLQGTYTKRFNVRHKEWGHLFQGRYKALLVDHSGDYFSTVAAYIHLNPARIKGFDFERSKLEDHVWSSYPGYLQPQKRPEWLCVERVLACAGLNDTPHGRSAYRELFEKRMVAMQHATEPWKVDEAWDRIRRGECFGDESFRDELNQRLDGCLVSKKRESFSGAAMKRHDEEQANRLIEQGLTALGLQEEDLFRLPKNSPEKYALAWLIRRVTCVRPAWIKERLRMGKATNFANFLKRMTDGEFGAECFGKVKTVHHRSEPS
jgi:hypothetical protein